MKILTLSKKTISILQPIVQVGNTKLGPLPLNLESVLDKLKTGNKFENDPFCDRKFLNQLQEAGFVSVSDKGVFKSLPILNATKKELLELFNSKFRVESLSTQKKSMKTKTPKPIATAKKAVAKAKPAKKAVAKVTKKAVKAVKKPAQKAGKVTENAVQKTVKKIDKAITKTTAKPVKAVVKSTKKAATKAAKAAKVAAVEVNPVIA